ESLADSQGRLKTQGGQRFNERELVAAEKAALGAELNALHVHQRELAGGCLPLWLMARELERLRTIGVQRAEAQVKSVAAEAVRQEFEAFLSWSKLRKDWNTRTRREVRT